MANYFPVLNNGYWYKAHYEGKGAARKVKKEPLILKGKRPRNRDEALRFIWDMEQGNVDTPSADTTIKSFLPTFKSYLEDKEKSDLTISTYEHDVIKAEEALPRNMKDIALVHIEQYLSGLSVSPQTKQKYAKSLSRFFSIAVKWGKITKNPVEGYEFSSYKPNVVVLSEEAIDLLLRAATEMDEQGLNGKYNYAFIMFALQTGLRLDEYTNLRWKHLGTDRTYHIFEDETFHPKHGVERTIYIPKESFDLITGLPRVCDYIFHKDGKRYTHGHLPRAFANNIFKAAGVKCDLHDIRKTFTSYRIALGQPLQNVKAALGHSSIKETEAYIGKVTNPTKRMKKIFGGF